MLPVSKPAGHNAMRDPAMVRSRLHHAPVHGFGAAERLFTLLALLFLIAPTYATVTSLDLMQRELPFAEPAFEQTHTEAIELLDVGTGTSTDRALEQLLALLDAMPDDHTLRANVQLNAAIALAASGDIESALALVQSALDAKRTGTGPYDLQLIPFMLAEGDVLAQAQRIPDAITAYQRAQNVSHRQLGVYNPAQIPVIERIIRAAALGRGTHLIETQLGMTVRIARESMTPEAEATMLLNLADHYRIRTDEARRSKIVAFDTPPRIHERIQLGQTAIRHYEGAVELLRPLDEPELLATALHSLARTWSFIGRPRSAKRVAREFLEVVRAAHGDTSIETGQALIATGDIFLVSLDHRSNDYYLEAWSILEADPDLRERLLGVPKRLRPTRTRTYPTNRRPSDVGPHEPLIVRMEYTVRADGRTGDIKILQATVLSEERRVSRSWLKGSLFRPRFVDGVAVATPNQIHVQPFRDGAPDALFPWNQERLEEQRAREEAAATTATE